MTSHPSNNATSRKRVASTLSALQEQKVVTNGQLGSFMLRNHGRFYSSWLTHAFAYILMKEYYDAEEGCAYPSVKRIASELGINARTVSRLVKQMKDAKDDNGCPLWRIETGRNFLNIVITNRYYPLFVKDVLADPKRNDAKIDRENTETLTWDSMEPRDVALATALMEMESEVPVTEDETIPKRPEAGNYTEHRASGVVTAEVVAEPVVDTQAAEVVQGTTDRDQEILAVYKEVQEYKSSDDYVWERPLPVVGTVTPVVMPSEVSELANDGNPRKLFVAGSEDVFLEEMAGKWITMFASKYKAPVSPSYIQDVYDELIDGTTDLEQVQKRDAAMYVLGSRGIKPTAGFVKFLLSNSDSFNPESESFKPEQVELRNLVHATAEGRMLTMRLSRQNHYGNYTPEQMQKRLYVKTYSDQM